MKTNLFTGTNAFRHIFHDQKISLPNAMGAISLWMIVICAHPSFGRDSSSDLHPRLEL